MNPALPDPLAPQELARATALDAAFYLGEGMLARDRRAVFARSWQLVGHENALAGIGDHLVTDLAGLPVLVVRDSQGVLRAFHNVCRHRAGPLATCDGKGAKALRCQYHGWTYTLEGVLRSAPEMKDVPDFEPSSIRLPELRVGVWQGLVFVGGEGAVDFADFSRGLDEPLRSLSPRDRKSTRLNSSHVKISYAV